MENRNVNLQSVYRAKPTSTLHGVALIPSMTHFQSHSVKKGQALGVNSSISAHLHDMSKFPVLSKSL